jgi:glucan-binding YG repeat protein
LELFRQCGTKIKKKNKLPTLSEQLQKLEKKQNYHTVGTAPKSRKTKTTTLSEQLQNLEKNKITTLSEQLQNLEKNKITTLSEQLQHLEKNKITTLSEQLQNQEKKQNYHNIVTLPKTRKNIGWNCSDSVVVLVFLDFGTVPTVL